jgi:demethylmenaquinone methyltransferase/2-methoxy-6-polyprenyl-1,4-benzoquinol methylase
MIVHENKSTEVRRIFRRIHRRYDLLNRLMSFGQDQGWRGQAVARLTPSPQALILDVGAGTGSLSAAVLRRHPDARVVAVDFTREMMLTGRHRYPNHEIFWVQADAAALPFKQGTFQGVVSGFLLRNVAAIERVLREQRQVLADGQRMVCLESNPARRSMFRAFIRFHFEQVIPTLGSLLAQDRQAYDYLTRSMDGFLPSEELLSKMRAAGFTSLGAKQLMLGTIAIHWGSS